MATLSFDLPTKIATVQSPDTSISCQEIYDQFRDFEDSPPVMSNKDLIAAAGKDALAGGAETIITVRLLDGWRLKFDDRAGPGITECVVTGGNLVGSDEAGVDQLPIEPADYVFVSFANATTGALFETGISGLTAAESAQLSIIDTLRKIFVNKMVTDPATGKMIIYDDDDVAVLVEGPIWEDVLASISYRGKGIERRDRLT